MLRSLSMFLITMMKEIKMISEKFKTVLWKCIIQLANDGYDDVNLGTLKKAIVKANHLSEIVFAIEGAFSNPDRIIELLNKTYEIVTVGKRNPDLVLDPIPTAN
jgi:hypothetical protein